MHRTTPTFLEVYEAMGHIVGVCRDTMWLSGRQMLKLAIITTLLVDFYVDSHIVTPCWLRSTLISRASAGFSAFRFTSPVYVTGSKQSDTHMLIK
jgi:hypothetical protein